MGNVFVGINIVLLDLLPLPFFEWNFNDNYGPHINGAKVSGQGT